MFLLFFFLYLKYQFFLCVIFTNGKKRNPWLRVAWDGGMYSKGGLRICVETAQRGNGLFSLVKRIETE
jgi:hypothetical protein